LNKCEQVLLWLEDNQRADKEAFEFQKKELEVLCIPIMKRIINRADGVVRELTVAGIPALNVGESPETKGLQSDVCVEVSRRENNKESSYTGNGVTWEKEKGKHSYI
jgi:L1 cell adhesion molecule like protein